MVRRNWPLVLILTLFVTLASLYSVVNPLFEAPDEVWHYEYIRWLVEGRGLPQLTEVERAPWRQEGSQPPLYYLLVAGLTGWVATDNAAAVIRYNPHAAVGEAGAFGNKNLIVHSAAHAWPWQGVTLAAHLARFVSVLLGAVTVGATYATARLLAPDRPALAAGSALLVALNPQFLFLSAAINNDNLVTACCAVGVWQTVALLVQHVPSRTPPLTTRQAARLGLVLGAAALSKLSGLALGLVLAVLFVVRAWQGRSLAVIVRPAAVTGAVALLVAGWWYGRNWWLYGDPLGLAAMFAALPGQATPLTVAEVGRLLPGIWRSFWAVFGWFNVVADPWLYTAYTALTLLAAAGLLIGWGRTWARRSAPRRWLALGVLWLWVAIMALLLLRWAQISHPQGRLFFPAISALAILLAWGLSNWLPERWQNAVMVLLGGLLFVPAVIAPWRWIAPAYAAPPLLTLDAAVPNATAHDFGDQLRLRGFAWMPSLVQPGTVWTLDLYWQGLQPLTDDYTVFVHLTDDLGSLQAQRDSFPASGALATSTWPTAVLIPDQHRLTLPVALPPLTRLRIDVGVYDYTTGQRLASGGRDFVTLGTLDLPPDSGPAARIHFGETLALVDYQIDPWRLRPGAELAVSLTWEALVAPPLDYAVFVHLLLPPSTVWAQSDAMPQGGAAPTSAWQAGQRVADRLTLRVPPDAAPGLYNIEIGLYDPATGERLRVDGSDAGVLLGRVRVYQE
jgi:hypothetical protein